VQYSLGQADELKGSGAYSFIKVKGEDGRTKVRIALAALLGVLIGPNVYSASLPG
jgi:hypothetical protein